MIKPLGNVVTTRLTEVEITASGIFVPSQVAEAITQKLAEVLAVGELVTRVKVGDKVVFKPFATFDVELKRGDKYAMLEEDDILGIVEE